MYDYTIHGDADFEGETPVGVLSRVDLTDYDRTIADFKKKKAEKELAQQKLIAYATKLCNAVADLLATYSRVEASGLASEFNRVDATEALLADGIMPPNAEDLLREFSGYLDKVTKLRKNLTRVINLACPALRPIDAKLSADLRSKLGAVEHICKRLMVHYSHMTDRAKSIVTRSRATLDGPVARAYRLYAEALKKVGARSVGGLEPDLRHKVPLYKLPVGIDAAMINDRRRIRELEREADEYVGERDPTAVGTIIFRFEPANGAEVWR
jgi:hypothetical protein